MSKIPAWWLLISLLIGIAAAVIFLKFFFIPDKTVSIGERPQYDVVTLKLPRSIEADIFGPKYWEAFHTLTNRIPCSICRDKAVPFMSFFHDVVNQSTGKPIFNKENYNKHIDLICKLPKA